MSSAVMVKRMLLYDIYSYFYVDAGGGIRDFITPGSKITNDVQSE